MYYRGMTLRIDLHIDDGDLLLIDALPVEPYPPYSADNVRVTGGSLIGGFRADDTEGRLEPMIVTYGTHTKIEFRHGNILTTGRKSSFVDFGITSKFQVLELKKGANVEYWRNAWFLPGKRNLE